MDSIERAAPLPASVAPIAMLGGTFDPVHYGHLHLAADVRDALALPEVRLVPAGVPPHRAAPVASAADRVAMLGLAVREFVGLVVDTREIARPTPSYTVDTLDELRREAPRAPLLLLLGADAFNGLAGWREWRRLFDLAHLVVVPRPGIAPGGGLPPVLEREWHARRTDDPQRLRESAAGSIYVQPVRAEPVSSTALRAELAEGGAGAASVRGLLPATVLAYIESNRLYRRPPHAQ